MRGRESSDHEGTGRLLQALLTLMSDVVPVRLHLLAAVNDALAIGLNSGQRAREPRGQRDEGSMADREEVPFGGDLSLDVADVGAFLELNLMQTDHTGTRDDPTEKT
jgi:hypothetical protein